LFLQLIYNWRGLKQRTSTQRRHGKEKVKNQWSKPVVPKLVGAVTKIIVAIMSYDPQYFAVIAHNTEQHCHLWF